MQYQDRTHPTSHPTHTHYKAIHVSPIVRVRAEEEIIVTQIFPITLTKETAGIQDDGPTSKGHPDRHHCIHESLINSD